jgi:glycosyltransferase involved in cell wall biosynthesis
VTVSVLLPVYNGAATLREAVDSILAQDHVELELLLIDDASRDESAGIVSGYASRDDRVTAVLHDENVGLAATLNEGLASARHELVARMDQDDIAMPGRLRAQVDFMRSRPEIVLAGSFVFHMGADRSADRLVELPTTPREVARKLQRENCLYHPAVILRRSPVLAAGGYREEFENAEDYELWLRLARRHDLANVAEPLLRYRFSVSGMTLGRKWEQLRYVHLAQEMHREPGISLAEAERRADERLQRVDRRQFMKEVATGTVEELIRLRLWKDGRRLVRAFVREIGARESARLYLRLLNAQLRTERGGVSARRLRRANA